MSIRVLVSSAGQQHSVTPPPVYAGETGTLGPTDNEAPTATSDALARVIACIPSEVVLVYVATTAAIISKETSSLTGQWVAFWAYLGATPLVVLLGFIGGVPAGDQRRHRLKFSAWPWAQMTVGTVSFAIWGFTLPNSPFGDYHWYQASVATVVLLAGSLALGLVTPLLGIKNLE